MAADLGNHLRTSRECIDRFAQGHVTPGPIVFYNKRIQIPLTLLKSI